jgi:2Fe-2S ferredoxin
MIEIVFVSTNGTRKSVEANDGDSVMQSAIANNVDGIVAECGGAMACATCHVYVDDAFIEKVGAAGEEEAEMLEFASCEMTAESRLSCQIRVSPELNGLLVHLPDGQV